MGNVKWPVSLINISLYCGRTWSCKKALGGIEPATVSMTVGAFRTSVNRIERLYSSHSGEICYHHYHCHYYHYYHCTTMSAICTHISLIDQDAACSFSESIFAKSRLCLDRQVCAAHGHQISPAHITILRIDKTHTISSNLCLATFSFCFLFFNPPLWPQTKSKLFRPTILQSEITLVFLESPKSPDVSMWNHSSFHQQYVLSESLQALLFLEGGCGQMSRPSLFPASLPPSHVFSSCSAVWSKHAGKHKVSTAPRSEATFPERFLDKTETQSANSHMKWSRKYAHGEFALFLQNSIECLSLHLDVQWMSLCWTSRIQTISSDCLFFFFFLRT